MQGDRRMASRLAAAHGRFGGTVVALLMLALVTGAYAEDQPPHDQAAQAKAPSGQKGGAGQNAPVAEQHRLPPDSTTKHTLALPDRTLSFTAVAGSIRLFDDKGERSEERRVGKACRSRTAAEVAK